MTKQLARDWPECEALSRLAFGPGNPCKLVMGPYATRKPSWRRCSLPRTSKASVSGTPIHRHFPLDFGAARSVALPLKVQSVHQRPNGLRTPFTPRNILGAAALGGFGMGVLWVIGML